MNATLSSRLKKLSPEKCEPYDLIFDIEPADLQARAEDLIGDGLNSIRTSLATLSPSSLIIALRACLLLWTVTGGQKVPRQMQLESIIPLMEHRDSLVNAGTGSGKTICMVLPVLLDPRSVTLVVSPLKRLQLLQVIEYGEYGVEAFCVNADTPDDEDIWTSIKSGYYPVLIVSPESLDNFEGHVPRFARLLRGDRAFSRHIKRVLIDEVHNIYTSGTTFHGMNAHRPAWGALATLRVFLEKGTPIQGLSGTLPPHIIEAIVQNLHLPNDHAHITFTSNRPNITYATREIVKSLTTWSNLDCLIPIKCKTIIFFDDKRLAMAATTYLDNHPQLPESQRGAGLVREYHGDMSAEYLTRVFEDFKPADGKVRILCATSGCSTGIDISDVLCVIQYGICQDVPNWCQRGGRAGRGDSTPALFLTMYEPWVKEVNLSFIKEDAADPDKPLKHITSKQPTKKERTGVSALQILQSDECLRLFFARYLDDCTATRILFTNEWCCDRHADMKIDFTRWLGSAFFAGKVPKTKAEKSRKRGPRPVVRRNAERGPLKEALHAWREKAHAADRYRAFRTVEDIIRDKGIIDVARIAPKEISITSIVAALGETDEWSKEWGLEVQKVIHGYDFTKRLEPLDAELKKGIESKTGTGSKDSVKSLKEAQPVESKEEGIEGSSSESESSDDEPIYAAISRKCNLQG